MKRLVISLALLCAAFGGALCSGLVMAGDRNAAAERIARFDRNATDERIARALETIAKELEIGNNLRWGRVGITQKLCTSLYVLRDRVAKVQPVVIQPAPAKRRW